MAAVVETKATLIEKYFGKDAKVAEAICMAESHCTPSATHLNSDGSTDYGEFQINSVHIKRVGGDLSRLLDPETNIRVAAEIFHEQGFMPWVTYQTGKYLAYLK